MLKDGVDTVSAGKYNIIQYLGRTYRLELLHITDPFHTLCLGKILMIETTIKHYDYIYIRLRDYCLVPQITKKEVVADVSVAPHDYYECRLSTVDKTHVGEGDIEDGSFGPAICFLAIVVVLLVTCTNGRVFSYYSRLLLGLQILFKGRSSQLRTKMKIHSFAEAKR